MTPQELDFSSAPTSGAIDLLSPQAELAVVGSAFVVFIAAIALSARLAIRASARTPALPRLSQAPAALRATAAITLVSLLLIEALGGLDAFLMTRSVHESADEYFGALSWVRLVGISHAHLFGYAILYGLLATLAALTSARERTKCILVSALLWSGIFDVISWWGIKAITPRFEHLTIATGAGTAIATFAAVFLIARELFAGKFQR